jgi:hypothetical protein
MHYPFLSGDVLFCIGCRSERENSQGYTSRKNSPAAERTCVASLSTKCHFVKGSGGDDAVLPPLRCARVPPRSSVRPSRETIALYYINRCVIHPSYHDSPPPRREGRSILIPVYDCDIAPRSNVPETGCFPRGHYLLAIRRKRCARELSFMS